MAKMTVETITFDFILVCKRCGSRLFNIFLKGRENPCAVKYIQCANPDCGDIFDDYENAITLGGNENGEGQEIPR